MCFYEWDYIFSIVNNREKQVSYLSSNPAKQNILSLRWCAVGPNRNLFYSLILFASAYSETTVFVILSVFIRDSDKLNLVKLVVVVWFATAQAASKYDTFFKSG